LRRLFGIAGERPKEEMNVVCRIEGMLFSFLVDRIGEVTEVESVLKEPPPATIDLGVRRFIESICKLPGELLTIVDIEKISQIINATSKDQREE
jgi:chemotaxis signal transduction protein